MIIIKSDVLLKKGLEKIQTEIVLAIQVAYCVYQNLNRDMVITSVLDGQHMIGSLHYMGMAVDLGLPGIIDPEVLRNVIDANLNGPLGPRARILYDVLYEKPIKNHIHIE